MKYKLNISKVNHTLKIILLKKKVEKYGSLKNLKFPFE